LLLAFSFRRLIYGALPSTAPAKSLGNSPLEFIPGKGFWLLLGWLVVLQMVSRLVATDDMAPVFSHC
jgi:hypothetical protein